MSWPWKEGKWAIEFNMGKWQVKKRERGGGKKGEGGGDEVTAAM
jgi:hypothetical protein